ncbi:MAG: class I SAM-dependent methyltransferase, partial [Fimbriimonadaceae bacterium]|nr:class I SAM-dependent methyltransferase [Alphaproteobacteria bacterium]
MSMPTHKPKEAVENRRDKYGISFRVAELNCCPQCNDNNIKKLLDAEDFQGESGSYSAYECEKCGALFCNPQVVDEDIPKLYEARNTQDFNPTVDRNSLIFRLRMFHARRQIRDFLGRIGKPTQYRAMDFGCGDGMFSLALAGNLNCLSVTAVDFQNEPPPALAFTPVDYASISDLASGAADGSYDVVICRHIVEHVTNPREFVRQSARYLKPGGHLFVEVPNFQSIWRRIFGQHWSILYVPRHLYWFTEKNLGQVFDS